MEDGQRGKNMVGRKGAGVPGLRADAQRRKGEPAAFFDSNPGTEVPWLRERFRDHGEGGGRLYDFDRFTTDMFVYGRARCYVRRGQPMTPITDEALAEIKALAAAGACQYCGEHVENCRDCRGAEKFLASDEGKMLVFRFGSYEAIRHFEKRVCGFPFDGWPDDVSPPNAATVASLIARIEAAEARVKRLEEALKPFADHAPSFLDRTPDDDIVVKSHAHWPAITLGDLRRARAALEGE